MDVKFKPSIIYIQTFLNMFSIYWVGTLIKKLVSAEDNSEERGVKLMLFFANGEVAIGKNLLVNIFFSQFPK